MDVAGISSVMSTSRYWRGYREDVENLNPAVLLLTLIYRLIWIKKKVSRPTSVECLCYWDKTSCTIPVILSFVYGEEINALYIIGLSLWIED